MALDVADQFHVGIVVDDFESTLAELSAAFGYEWCEEVSRPIELLYPDGRTAAGQTNFVYSRNGPRLEIIRSVAGTVWVPVEGSGIHHLGYWSDDVAADSDALVRDGFTVEVVGPGPGGVPTFTYHRHASGLRVELITSAAKPAMEAYFATGKASAIGATPLSDPARQG